MNPDPIAAHAVPLILGAVTYAGILLSLPILSAIGQVFLSGWLDRRHAARVRADLDAIERRHQAADGRAYGEE